MILRGGLVVTMDSARRVLDGAVVIKDGRIAAVGRSDGKAESQARSVLDCRGLVVVPGLIQAHVHLCQTLFRGLADDLSLEDWLARRIWPLEAAHTEETIYSSTVRTCGRWRITRFTQSGPKYFHCVPPLRIRGEGDRG